MLTFKNIVPTPLVEKNLDNSNIWASDCTFEKGKNYLVVAPSGKGKSTFLNIAYGLRKDFTGTVTINNQTTTDFKIDDWSKQRQGQLSMIFQDLRLFPQMTGLENIQLKNKLQNHKTDTDIQNMATELGVADILNQTCGTMSYGQQQRIAIIRSLCQPFSMLLLDEPFSHLDDNNIKKACQLIELNCKEQKAGMILVSLGEQYYFDYDVFLEL